MANNNAAQAVSRQLTRIYKIRAYLDTVRLATEHKGEELGESLPFADPIEDCLLMLDTVRDELDDLRSALEYGKAA